MAKRFLQQTRQLRNLPYICRHLNSSPPSFSSALNLTDRSDSTILKPILTPSLDDIAITTTNTITESATSPPCSNILNFEDGKELFSSVSTKRLMRSSLTLHMAAFEPMVDVGIWVMNSRLMVVPLMRNFILETVKHTFYHHFCAGPDLEEVGRTILKLRGSGLKGMLDYGLEHATDNESCDQNLKDFIQTIQSTKSLPTDSVSFAVVKITAICPPSLLKRVSDQLRWEHKDSSFNLPWKRKSLPLFTELSPLYHTPNKPQPLTIQEEKDLQLAHDRLQKICEKCVETDVPLLVDAEDTIVQPAIDYMTYSAAITYYKDDDPIVFGTIQAYLRDAKERLIQTTNAAEKMGVPMGFKLVRGAYMSSEGRLAAAYGAKSPIHDSIAQTHACFNGCASFMLDQIANGSGAVVLATHNIESGRLAAAKAIELGIKESHKLQFAQLYGMSEALSFALRNAGFHVSKYLPFGQVGLIMPYLLRRAEENRGLLSTSSLDRELMRKELVRRFKSVIV
ncbi:oxidase [Lithospermum erythrorhizon]|uniref:Proline dehydrogenase n=1 Tax=Lithospermum erythrorhizon TaxID=34254 RepID=A0AAV3P8P3_LITER